MDAYAVAVRHLWRVIGCDYLSNKYVNGISDRSTETQCVIPLVFIFDPCLVEHCALNLYPALQRACEVDEEDDPSGVHSALLCIYC